VKEKEGGIEIKWWELSEKDGGRERERENARWE
jgi:hypothetical protein